MSRFDAHAEAELRRLARVKQLARPTPEKIGAEMATFFKQSVQKRQTKFASIAKAWETLIPSTLSEHCALESFSKGILGVIVDSSAHLYELKQVLLAGLEKQLMLACRSAGLKKITLKQGRWYDGESHDRRVKF